jgi:hypothetical protein
VTKFEDFLSWSETVTACALFPPSMATAEEETELSLEMVEVLMVFPGETSTFLSDDVLLPTS